MEFRSMRSLRSEAPPRPGSGTARALPPIKAVRPAARRQAQGPAAESEPTVLLVGADQGFEPALRLALSRHRVYVETATPDTAVETVIVTAPDLVLLTNEAAREGGRALLARLSASPSSSVVPVAILDDNPALDQRLQAFRHGAAAVIPRSASIDAIAEQVAKLARDIPERGGEALGQVGEATLAEFVTALSNELRSGILSVHPASEGEQPPVRLVLGSGRPLAAFIDDFVTRVRRHVVHAEPLRYEFDDRAGGTVRLLDATELDFAQVAASMRGLRVALADGDSARADNVAQELRARGATVVVTDLAPSDARFARLRQVDPMVLIAGEQDLQGEGYRLLKRMRRDTRLRWVSLLVVRWEEIWSESLSVPALDRLQAALASLAETDRLLTERAANGETFDTRLEITGPARLMRALVGTPRALRVTVANPRLHASLDVSDGLVVGASSHPPHDPSASWDGPTALAALLMLSSGRVHVESVLQPAATNVMTTIDVALNMADNEPSPITPSIPTIPITSLPPPPPPSAHDPHSLGPDAQAFSTEVAQGLGMAPRTRARARLAGISKPMAALLVGLACAQGLGVAWFFGSLSRKTKPPATAASAIASSPALPAVPAAKELALTAAAGPASAEPQTPGAIAPAAPVHAMKPEQQRGAPLGKDESGNVAPSCAALLAPHDVDVGNFPGAAYEQMRAADKLVVQGRVDEAQLAVCKAVRWDAQNPEPHMDLAQLFLIRRDGAAAAEAARRAVELDPLSGRAHSLLGDGLARIGDHDGAKQAWLLAANISPGDAVKYQALLDRNLGEAEAALAKHDVSRAERFFRRSIVMDPDSVPASRGLSAALTLLGDGPSAIRWAQRALSREPRDPRSHLVLGDALFLTGDKVGAEQEWREANRLDPADRAAQKRLRRLRELR